MKKFLNRKNIGMALMFSCVLVSALAPEMAFASTVATNQVIGKFENFGTFFRDVISVLGQIYTLWGISEWGLSMHESNGTMGSQSFKRIFGGLVVVLAPQIVSIIA